MSPGSQNDNPTTLNVEKIRALFDQFNFKYFDGLIRPPSIRISKRMTRAAGKVTYSPWEMVISAKYHDTYNWQEELEDTVKHEMVHLFLKQNGRPSGHTDEFKEICKRIGCDPQCAKPMPKRPIKYVFICPECGREFRRRKWITGSCRRCGGGKYNSKFKLVLKERLY